MPRKYGTVTTPFGASGLLTELLAFICGTEVVAENLTGAGTAWDGTLAHFPVGLGRLLIDYTIGGTAYQAVDDGSGVIIGTLVSAGSIVYADGTYSIDFDSVPTGTPTASYIYGEPGRDWRVVINRNSRTPALPSYTEPWGSDMKEVILSNTGLSGQESIMIGIREWKYAVGNGYGWDLNGYITYVVGNCWNSNNNQHLRTTYSTTWNRYTYHPGMPLYNGSMNYFFYVNQQRIVIQVKVQTQYEGCYFGFGRRFGPKTVYQYPLAIIGTHHGNNPYTLVDTNRRYIIGLTGTGVGRYFIVKPDNVYLTGVVLAQSYPFYTFVDLTSLELDELNRAMVTPTYIVDDINEVTFMDLDGVYMVNGNGLVSEDRIIFNGKTHKVFPDINRTAYNNFLCIEEATTTTTTTTTS